MAYDHAFRLSPLSEALNRADELGITLVSMKHDWKSVFDEPMRAATASVRADTGKEIRA